MPKSAPNPFLDQELAARFAGGALDLLQTEPTLEGILDLARIAIFYADRSLTQLEAVQPLPQPIACEPGCDACCYNQVEITAPEALFLGSFLAARLSPPEKEGLRQRAEQHLARRAGLSPVQVAALRAQLPCPLLQEHYCLAYEARPLFCRAMHSLSQADCYQELADPSLTRVRFYSHRHIVYVSLSHALVQVGRIYGWRAGPLDLAQTILYVTESLGALATWLFAKAGDKDEKTGQD